jgi:hypothetical protein
MPLRRQVLIGVIASFLLHILFFGTFVVVSQIKQGPPKLGLIPLPIEIEVLPPEPEPSILPAPSEPEQPFIDSRGLAESKPAEKPLFESDKDMTAASETAASGDLPLPSQEGKGRFENVFETTQAKLGKVAEPPVLEMVSAPPAPPVQPSPPSPPAPPARETPTPPKPPQIANATPAPAAATPPPKPDKPDKPDPSTLAKTTLEKLREVEKRREDELALAAKQQLPPLPDPVTRVEKPPEIPVMRATPAHPEQVAKLTTPAPFSRPPSQSGYQPEQEKSRVEGQITNRGRNAVDSKATPLGKYKSQVYNAIGARWLYYVKNDMDKLAIGSAKVSFYITRSGRVEGISVDGNTANRQFANVCEQAIRDAEISRPPAGTLDELRDARLDYTITFTLYSLHE